MGGLLIIDMTKKYRRLFILENGPRFLGSSILGIFLNKLFQYNKPALSSTKLNATTRISKKPVIL